MCGLFGIVHGEESVPCSERLFESGRLLSHRGPDANGVHSAPGIGLAHTRLSFLDPEERANQPMWDAERRFCIVFNGEIYNYRELRRPLEARGVVFRTGSDTEVLLQCLIHDNAEDVLASLRGMFSLAFYDVREHTILLARDRFGMKPMYYCMQEGVLLFASEVKAFRPWLPLDVDRFSVGAYLLGFGGPTSGATMYAGVQALRPGDLLRVRRGGELQPGTFFRLDSFWDAETAALLEHTPARRLVDMMEQRLLEAVESHQFADVPVGAFCSGGVDSSLLMAMAAKSHSNLAVFHADMVGPWSEHAAAERLARFLKLDLKVVRVTESDIVDRFTTVMAHYEHPYTYHPNCAPLMMVAELARENGVKGLLSGEGSDECFLGYPWLGRKRLVDAWFNSWRGTRRLLSRIPGFGRVLFPATESATSVRALFSRREIEDDRARARNLSKTSGRPDARDLWTLDYLGHHLRTLLHRNDTMGMAASIEARFPFLDHPIVSMAVNLPASTKLRLSPTVLEKAHPFVRDKWIVRQVADRHIPRELSQRIKIGFWTTAFQRLQVRESYFDDSSVRDLFELSRPQVRAVVADADQDLRLRLLHLDVWLRVCVEGRNRTDVQSAVKSSVVVSPN